MQRVDAAHKNLLTQRLLKKIAPLFISPSDNNREGGI
jgi:hypothetical protein